VDCREVERGERKLPPRCCKLRGPGVLFSLPEENRTHNKSPEYKKQTVFTGFILLFSTGSTDLYASQALLVTFGDLFKAVQSKSKPQLSLEGIAGTGPRTRGNDAESIYGADDRPPCGHTPAPKGRGERTQAHSIGLGSFHPETTTSPKGR